MLYMCVCIYIHICIYTYMYIYIYFNVLTVYDDLSHQYRDATTHFLNKL